MPGLTQLELDALCISEASTTEPSSPIGSALLARKRQRQAKCQLHVAVQDASVDLGLSQAELDDLRVEEPPAEDACPSSPLGTSLRRIKNRRRWGAPVVEKGYPSQSEVVASPPCPASWGSSGTGLSQADLDAMCGEEPIPETTVEEKAHITTSPGHAVRNSPTKTSVCGSPPMRKRRGKRMDAENVGVVTPNQSPAKAMDMTSPGKGTEEILSPMRRSPGWRANPLSPVGLNCVQ